MSFISKIKILCTEALEGHQINAKLENFFFLKIGACLNFGLDCHSCLLPRASAFKMQAAIRVEDSCK